MNTKTKHWASITAGILSLAGYASAANLGSEKYVYDASGNIIEKSIDGKVTKMSFDSSNRLLAEENADNQQKLSTSFGYGGKVLKTQKEGNSSILFYNAEGQLVGKSAAGSVSTYSWDGNVLSSDSDQVYSNESHISGGVPVLSSTNDVVVSDYLGTTLISGKNNFSGTAYGEGLEKGRYSGKPYIKELSST